MPVRGVSSGRGSTTGRKRSSSWSSNMLSILHAQQEFTTVTVVLAWCARVYRQLSCAQQGCSCCNADCRHNYHTEENVGSESEETHLATIQLDCLRHGVSFALTSAETQSAKHAGLAGKHG
eukprot:GHUV01025294.1.p1 GENE.GHUV01025294.1~~GHUV01025294.1.p1  ORF type:complete len:121 (-),score=15.70 GHUV01025294.1:183-545(-)